MSASTDVDRERRDLYAVSLGIILFNVADGSFTGEVGSILGGIRFAADPIVFPAAAWIAWAYFFWRFRIASGDIFAGIADDMRKALHYSSAFRRACARHTRRLKTETAEFARQPGIQAKELMLANSVLSGTDWVTIETRTTPRPLESSKFRVFEFFRRCDPPNIENQSFGHYFDHSAQILPPFDGGRWKPSLAEWFVFGVEAVFIMIFARPYFGDRVLPYIIGCSAPIVVLGLEAT